MALSGFFKVDFGAALPGIGGIVIVENNVVRGSDGQFLFSGSFSGSPDALTATVRVKSVAGQPMTVFGTNQSSFDLALKGTESGDTFSLAGDGSASGQTGIRIEGVRIAALDLTHG